MRSGSQPAKRRDEEVRRSLIGIPAFLKSFCLDLQKQSSKGLQGSQVPNKALLH